MASYGLKYFAEFDSIPTAGQDATRWRLEFAFRDYLDGPSEVTCANPGIIAAWTLDEARAPIKASSCEISIVATPTLSMNDFYTESDNGVRITIRKVTAPTAIYLQHFIVQDDFSEVVTDSFVPHVISLSSTDNLGLLKDTIFSDANKRYGTGASGASDVQIISNLPGQPQVISLSNLTLVPQANGDIVQFYNAPGLEGIEFTVLSWTVSGGTVNLTVDPHSPFTNVFFNAQVVYRHPQVLTDRIPISKIFAIIFNATGLELETRAYLNIRHERMTDWEMLSQTYLRGTDIADRDCYAILSGILERLKATLFQAHGKWHIIRWPELRNGNPAWQSYDKDFNVTTGGGGFYNERVDLQNGQALVDPQRT